MSDDKGAGADPPAPMDAAHSNAFAHAVAPSGDSELTGHLLEAWKKTVDVQQHFNQIEMDIRKTAVTVIVAAIGAAGFAADHGMQMVLLGSTINVAFLIVLAGIVALGAFFFMDFFQYHKLLKGAVEHGMVLEQALSQRGVPVSLTNTIGKFSAMTVAGSKFRSDDKIKLFYKAILAVMFLIALGALGGSPATKAAATSTPQTIEIAPKSAFQADVRIVSLPLAATMPALAPSTGPSMSAAVPVGSAPMPAPSPAPPAQIQTGQAAPQSSE